MINTDELSVCGSPRDHGDLPSGDVPIVSHSSIICQSPQQKDMRGTRRPLPCNIRQLGPSHNVQPTVASWANLPILGTISGGVFSCNICRLYVLKLVKYFAFLVFSKDYNLSRVHGWSLTVICVSFDAVVACLQGFVLEKKQVCW